MSAFLRALTKPSATNAPPSPRERYVRELALLGWVLFLLLLGWGIRNQTLRAHNTHLPAEGLTAIAYPSNWVVSNGEAFRAANPRSPSTFDSEIAVVSRPLKAGEELAAARAAWTVSRSRQFQSYREIETLPATVLDGAPALVSTYAYVADPLRNSAVAGLPVVVEAQDIMYVDANHFVVVSLAADATAWAADQLSFDLVRNSLHLVLAEDGGIQ